MGITEEQKAQFLELALISTARKRVTNMFKEDRVKAEPKRKCDMELVPACPHCGSKNILAPTSGFNLNWECFDCKKEFDIPMFSKGMKRRKTIDQTKLPESGVRNIPKKAKKEKPKKSYARYQNRDAKTHQSQHKRLCPYCGSGWIRAPKLNSPQYRCHDCGEKFEKPVQSWAPNCECCVVILEPAGEQ